MLEKEQIIEVYEVAVERNGGYITWNARLYESEHAADTARSIAKKKYPDEKFVILTKFLHRR